MTPEVMTMPAVDGDHPPDEVTALLIRARGFVERGWCRGAGARNFLGIAVTPNSRWATRWCMSGALLAARLGASELDYSRALSRLSHTSDVSIWTFNDDQKTVEPVLAAFDAAIAITASQEAGR